MTAIRRIGPVALIALAGVAWYVALARRDGIDHPLDKTILVAVGLNYALGALAMLVAVLMGWAPWTPRTLGFTSALAGGSVLWGVAALRLFGVVSMSDETLRDLAVATYAAGAPLLAVALVAWFVRTRAGTKGYDPAGLDDPFAAAFRDQVAIVADQRGRIIWASRESGAVLGWPADRLTGRSIRDLVPARFRARHDAGFALWQRTGTGPLIGGVVRVPMLRGDGTEGAVCLELSTARLASAMWAVALMTPADQCRGVDADLTGDEAPETVFERRAEKDRRNGWGKKT